MATNVVVNGVTYSVPSYGDTGWGQGTNSVNNLLIALSAALATTPAFMQLLLVSASPTTVSTGRTLLVDTSTIPITLNLPAPAANFWFAVKDKKGTTLINPITIHRFAAEKIDGTAVDATLTSPFGSWTFFSDGTDWYSLNYV